VLSGQPAQEALLRLSGASGARLPYCLTSQSVPGQDVYHLSYLLPRFMKAVLQRNKATS